MKHLAYGVPLLAAILALPVPAFADDAPADPSSAIGKAGQVILDAVQGRTYELAFAKSKSPTNPFGIDFDKVASAAGAKSVGSTVSGTAAAEGQLSILPQFNTPQAKFGVSSTSPAIIPFAVLVGGKCLGGYVTGYPIADHVFSTDMAQRDCSAAAIDNALSAAYPLKVAMASSAKPALDATTANPATIDDISFAGDTALALPGSDVDKVGQVILQAVAGRSLDQALADGASKANPFDLNSDPLLNAAGVYFVSSDNSGASVGSSELSIFPDYITPGGKFTASEQTPPIMPFAFNRGGICQGGYVTGYPTPDKIFAVDMHGKHCTARAIDEDETAAYGKIATANPEPSDTMVADNSSKPKDATGDDASAAKDGTSTTPAETGATDPSADNAVFDGTSASDHDLEMIAYGAYTGAYNQALKHNNYFNSDDLNYAALRTAVRDALEKLGYGAASVAEAAVDSADAAKACATDGQIDLRIAFNDTGIGVSIVAVSDKRMAAYEYFPLKTSDLAIGKADDCLAAGAASAPAQDTGGDRLSTPAH